MYILGISCGGESGVALFKDSELICASNEERFSRIKLDMSFPKKALEWCLNYANIESDQVDLITYGFSAGCETLSQKLNWLDTLMSIDTSKDDAKIIKDRVITETEIDAQKYKEFLLEVKSFFKRDILIERINHHISHVATAYIASGMDKALVITADGRGDYRSVTICIATKDGFEELYISPSWNSLGYFYGRMTKLCGFTANRHEGKVTGLAASGDYKKALSFVKKMIYVKNGKVISNIGDYYRPFFSNYSQKLLDEASNFDKKDLAAATQYYFEEMIVELIKYYVDETKLTNIALAGGVFSNISLNQAIYEINKDIDIFVYPNMGDAGICVGSCYAWLWEKNKILPSRIESVYLGYEINSKLLYNKLKQTGRYTILNPNNIYDEIVQMLIDGKTIGLATSNAEFGPRALGNRSIIASPKDLNVIKKINNQLGRDIFMPLAPIIPVELADKFILLKNEKSINKGYFMTMTYDSKPILKDVAEAIVHLDGTVRPQFVTKEKNEFLHGLLMYWYDKTGSPALINTSFNAHEEPIVNDEKDVINALNNNVVDALLFPPYIAINS
ncbi:hypothetical protein FJR48_00860 [Sulfurimonas lithotrophica]|uniref:Carbamoyltransferase n=1 Tax=Sulfurimonas lithotrophica TaxID=2590022 RepID=A0A5P8NY48_9BACT|nr:carbamoyltransferase C-terminal domain-containing protein [Sulfurimonas lithotrophica]QFR48351.1 hypothetical protein FJR48_00860 [Sulfurimonas lithotrophica]